MWNKHKQSCYWLLKEKVNDEDKRKRKHKHMWNKHKQMQTNVLLVVKGKSGRSHKHKHICNKHKQACCWLLKEKVNEGHKHIWNKHKQMRNALLVVTGKVVEGDKHDPRRAHGPRLR